MAYGTIKVDNITFDNGGSDQNVTVSGLYRATTSGVTLSGTIAATTVSGVTVIGSTTVSGATVTGTTANFTNGTFGNVISSAATMSGALVMANQQQVRFRETAVNGINHIAIQAPASVSADQTITLPDQTGTFVTTGDNGSVSSTMLDANLTISAAVGTAGAPSIAFKDDLNTGIFSPGTDQVAISTNGIQRATIDSSGNIGIAVTAPTSLLHLRGTDVALRLDTFGSDDQNGVSLRFHQRDTVIINNQGYGGLEWEGSDASNTGVRGYIKGFSEGSAGQFGLRFATQASGVSAPLERVRIDSSGILLIGTSSASGSFLLQVDTGDATIYGVRVGRGAGAINTNTAVGNGALNANTTGGQNTAYGRDALSLNTTGASNTAIGRDALLSNTTGASNTAIGVRALRLNTTGSSNTAIGVQALLSNTDGIDNTAIGIFALSLNTTGNYNTASGREALENNTTGSENTANGVRALGLNTTGYYNTASGKEALYSNTIGNYNTANGAGALFSNTQGVDNTAIGANSLYSNTTGENNTANGSGALYSNTIGTLNTANGVQTLYSNTQGLGNTAIGAGALILNTTGNNNTANGLYALTSNTQGNNNTANGVDALTSNTNGSENTAVGYKAGYGDATQPNTTGSNNAFIGSNAMGASSTASNVITLGNSSIATLRCQVTTITSLSDKRDKKNIEPLNAGLDFLARLRPVSFTWDTRDKAKVDIKDTGFIAQELLAVQEDTGITIPNLVSQENPDKLEAGYGTLIPVLVSAVQELTVMVKQLQDKITTLEENN